MGMINQATINYLKSVVIDAENNGKRFIVQLEEWQQWKMMHFLEWCKENIDETIDVEECMNEKLWCAIDWLNYVNDNYSFN